MTKEKALELLEEMAWRFPEQDPFLEDYKEALQVIKDHLK